MSWLNELLSATDEAETPKSFIYWSGLAAISAIVKNNVYIKKGGLYRLYPTVYVILVAPSGLRKSFPVSVARKIVTKANATRIIQGRISIQAMISALSKAYTVEGEAKPRTDASCFIGTGELSTALVRDQDSFTILTDLYDNHYNPSWNYVLKSSGTEELKNISITLLGAINPPHFNDLMLEKDISGGFIARCILVLEKKRHRKNALLRPMQEIDFDALARYPSKLKSVSGEFTLTEPAIIMFEEWYQAFEPEEIEDKTGTANRLHDHILKTAMLISLAESTKLVITDDHMAEAMNACMKVSLDINKITAGSGKSKLAPQQALVLQHLLNSPGGKATRTEILKKHYGDLDAFDLDQIISTITQAGGVTVSSENKDIVYTLSPSWVEQYNKIKKEG